MVKEYKGDSNSHAFMRQCKEHQIDQRFPKVNSPITNGKNEPILRTIMEMWHHKIQFKSIALRKTKPTRFVNFYNDVRPHQSLNNQTPEEVF